jgi:hypothetical protein
VEAERVFDRLLWLNPADNQGVRFNIASVRPRRTSKENEGTSPTVRLS